MKRTLIVTISAALLLSCAGWDTQNMNRAVVPDRIEFGNSARARLERNISDYESARNSLDTRRLFFIQQDFRLLMEEHSNDDIGETALYYIGRIYYDVNDHYDARLVFARHLSDYPRSEWRDEIESHIEEMNRQLDAYDEWLQTSESEVLGEDEEP